jgi:hypothetical protein
MATSLHSFLKNRLSACGRYWLEALPILAIKMVACGAKKIKKAVILAYFNSTVLTVCSACCCAE